MPFGDAGSLSSAGEQPAASCVYFPGPGRDAANREVFHLAGLRQPPADCRAARRARVRGLDDAWVSGSRGGAGLICALTPESDFPYGGRLAGRSYFERMPTRRQGVPDTLSGRSREPSPVMNAA